MKRGWWTRRSLNLYHEPLHPLLITAGGLSEDIDGFRRPVLDRHGASSL